MIWRQLLMPMMKLSAYLNVVFEFTMVHIDFQALYCAFTFFNAVSVPQALTCIIGTIRGCWSSCLVALPCI